MDLSKLGRCGGGTGIKLKGAQPAPFIGGNQFTSYGVSFSASGINASVALTQLCNIDVPAAKRMLIKSMRVDGLSSTSQPTLIELEIDGVTVLTTGNADSAATSVYVVGYTAVPPTSRQIMDLIAETNVKVRLRKEAASNAGIEVTYILVD